MDYVFKDSGHEFCRTYMERTWVESWDHKCAGYVSSDDMMALAKRVNNFGPVAGLLGREFEWWLQNHASSELIPVALMHTSILSDNGLSEKMLHEAPDWPSKI